MSLCQHNDGMKLREAVGVSSEISKSDESKWDINLWNKKDFINISNLEDTATEDKQEDSITSSISINKESFDEINSILSYKYPLKESTTLKSNISVSDLKRKNAEENYSIEEVYREKTIITPRFIKEKNGLTARKRYSSAFCNEKDRF